MIHNEDNEFEGYEYFSGIQRSIRRTKNYKGTPKFDRWDEYYDHGNEDAHLFYRLLFRFIEVNVGKSYDDVYAKFCGKYPALMLGYINTRKWFREYCGINDKYYRNDNPFYVDDNGIIRKNIDSWYYGRNHNKEKVIDTIPGTEYSEYIFNKELLKYPSIYNYLYTKLGEKTMLDISEKDTIETKKLYNRLIDIEKQFNYDYSYTTPIYKFYDKCGGWFVKVSTYSSKIIVTKGSNEYVKWKHEGMQAYKKYCKQQKREKELKNETLLHDICEAQRQKEYEQNLIDRDRLGFDDQSFIGEPYHGQKRKKFRNN